MLRPIALLLSLVASSCVGQRAATSVATRATSSAGSGWKPPHHDPHKQSEEEEEEEEPEEEREEDSEEEEEPGELRKPAEKGPEKGPEQPQVSPRPDDAPGDAPGDSSDDVEDWFGEENPFFDIDDFQEPTGPSAMKVSGYLDLTYGFEQRDPSLEDFDREGLFFNEPSISLLWDFAENWSFLGEVEYEGRDRTVRIEDFLLRREIPSLASRFDFGMIVVPFGIEREFSSSVTNPLIDRPAPFRRIFPGTYTDVGVMWSSRVPVGGSAIKFELAGTRGLRGPTREDRARDIPDRNDSVQGVGRLAFEAGPGVELGVSMLMTRSEGRRVKDLSLFGVDLKLQGDGWSLRTEYLEGGVDQREAGGDFRRKGWYSEFYHRIEVGRPYLEAVEGTIRWDMLDDNSRRRDAGDVQRLAFGINWIPRRNLRFKLEYLRSDERDEELRNDIVLVQAVWNF